MTHESTPALRRRLAAQEGFTMLLAIGVLVVTMLLTAAMFAAVQGDVSLTHTDLQGKRAYAAAQAGVQAYLNGLNTNASSSAWWENCSDDKTSGPVAVPGSTTGVTYQYQPVAGCNSANLVGTLIDSNTGAIRMEFTGSAGSQSRTIVANFRTVSPLSYLWYTVYETEDTSINPTGTCNRFYYQNPGPDSSCYIWWGAGDTMNGPMYSQDQFLIDPSGSPRPQLGRPNSTDQIVSQAPGTQPQDVCAFNNCQGASISNAVPNPQQQVPLPSDNSSLQTDAGKHGLVLAGTTTLTITGTTATAVTCASASQPNNCTTTPITLSAQPIIYVTNAGAGCSSTYRPTGITYQTNSQGNYYGPCGDLYVKGTYSAPLTLAAADDIVVTGNLTNTTDTNLTGTSSPSGSATLGLVANEYVRVMHDCASQNPNRTIDGAILTLQHSFFVDNYDCGGAPTQQNHATNGLLTVHGAIIQYFRGIVQLFGAGGYVKNYNYDDRLAVMLPPYLFDLQNTQWAVFRETLCSPVAPSSSPNSCAYTGP